MERTLNGKVWYLRIIKTNIFYKANDYHLLYNFIVPSVSPNEFLATHLYDPISAGPTAFTSNFITTLYALSTNIVSYFPATKKRGEKETNKQN